MNNNSINTAYQLTVANNYVFVYPVRNLAPMRQSSMRAIILCISVYLYLLVQSN